MDLIDPKNMFFTRNIMRVDIFTAFFSYFRLNSRLLSYSLILNILFEFVNNIF